MKKSNKFGIALMAIGTIMGVLGIEELLLSFIILAVILFIIGAFIFVFGFLIVLINSFQMILKG